MKGKSLSINTLNSLYKELARIKGGYFFYDTCSLTFNVNFKFFQLVIKHCYRLEYNFYCYALSRPLMDILNTTT